MAEMEFAYSVGHGLRLKQSAIRQAGSFIFA